jgi:hypothetical protein
MVLDIFMNPQRAVLLEDGSLAIDHLLSHSLVNVEKVACALVAAAA